MALSCSPSAIPVQRPRRLVYAWQICRVCSIVDERRCALSDSVPRRAFPPWLFSYRGLRMSSSLGSAQDGSRHLTPKNRAAPVKMAAPWRSGSRHAWVNRGGAACNRRGQPCDYRAERVEVLASPLAFVYLSTDDLCTTASCFVSACCQSCIRCQGNRRRQSNHGKT